MEKHHSCLNTRAIIEYFRERHEDSLPVLLQNLHEEIDDLPDSMAFLIEINNWVSSDVVIRLFENARQITGDSDIAFKIGYESSAGKKFSYIQRIVLAAYGNPRRSLRRAQKINDRFNRNKRIELLETTRDSAVLRLHWMEGIPAAEDFCLFNKGIYTGIPTLWDLPPAIVHETSCYFRGDSYCEYHLKWLKRFSIKDALLNLVLPWRTVKHTIAELEQDKEILKQKFAEVHQLNLHLQRKIAELLALQDDLQESETRFRILLDQIPGVAIQGFTADGIVHYWNRACEEIYGYSSNEAIGKEIAELIIPKDMAQAFRESLEKWGQEAGNGEYMPSGEHFRCAKNGDSVSIYAVCTAVRLKNKPPILFSFDLDIRGKKRAEEERMRLDKMESLGVLAGGIAHDFNNLLMVIMGNIGLAALSSPVPAICESRLREAEKACEQAQALSRRLLTFSKGGRPVKQLCSLKELLQDTSTFALSGSRSRAELFCADGLRTVEVDQGQMHQVFGNLMINADQAMPDGGTISIKGENITLGDDNDLSLAAGNYVKVTISDEGMGIPPKYLGKIFDPYFTTKQKGSGLGLATVYSIVRNHQGAIKVDSEVGVGTTFTLYLPAAASGSLAVKPVPAPPAEGEGHILVIDDEETIREVIGLMLGQLGYEVTHAKNGEEAIDLYKRAKAEGFEFAAVIADLTIPGGMGGEEAVRSLLQIDPQLKAVVSSGYSDDPVMSDFKRFGFKGALTKPFRMAELSKVLEEIMMPGKANRN